MLLMFVVAMIGIVGGKIEYNNAPVIVRIKENCPIMTRLLNLQEQVMTKYPELKKEDLLSGLSHNNFFVIDNNWNLLAIIDIDVDNADDLNLCQDGDYQDGRCVFKSFLVFSPRPLFIPLHIQIVDLDDNLAFWPQSCSTSPISVHEDTAIHTSFPLPCLPVDRDRSPRNRNVTIMAQYPLSRQHPFTYNRTLHKLVLSYPLDYEKASQMTVDLCVDVACTSIPVHVVDTNDNAPILGRPFIHIKVKEDHNVSLRIAVNFQAHDSDSGQFGQLLYSLSGSVSSAVSSLFLVDSQSGDLFLQRPLDYERVRDRVGYYVLIVISDCPGCGSTSRSFSNSVTGTVNITVVNVRDEPPSVILVYSRRGTGGGGGIQLLENTRGPLDLADIYVLQRRKWLPSCNCTLVASTGWPLTLDMVRGDATHTLHYRLKTSATPQLDREVVVALPRPRVDCSCSPHSSMLTTTQSISISVLDTNDNPPIFSQSSYRFTTIEGHRENTVIGRVNVTDADSDDYSRVTFKIRPRSIANLIHVNPNGELILKNQIDREKYPGGLVFLLIVLDTSSPPASESMSSTTSVTLEIEDVNDCAPKFNQSTYRFKITEQNQLTDEPIRRLRSTRKLIGGVTAHDDDLYPNNISIYRLIPNSVPFIITNEGLLIALKSARFDREAVKQFDFFVEVRDANLNQPTQKSDRSIARVEVKLEDVNDNVPEFVWPQVNTNTTVNVSFYEPQGSSVAQIKATDLDAGNNGSVKYYITRGNVYEIFELDESSGELSIKQAIQLRMEPVTLILTITAYDNGEPIKLSSSTTLSIILTSWAPIRHNSLIDQSQSSASNPIKFILINLLNMLTIFFVTVYNCYL